MSLWGFPYIILLNFLIDYIEIIHGIFNKKRYPSKFHQLLSNFKRHRHIPRKWFPKSLNPRHYTQQNKLPKLQPRILIRPRSQRRLTNRKRKNSSLTKHYYKKLNRLPRRWLLLPEHKNSHSKKLSIHQQHSPRPPRFQHQRREHPHVRSNSPYPIIKYYNIQKRNNKRLLRPTRRRNKPKKISKMYRMPFPKRHNDKKRSKKRRSRYISWKNRPFYLQKRQFFPKFHQKLRKRTNPKRRRHPPKRSKQHILPKLPFFPKPSLARTSSLLWKKLRFPILSKFPHWKPQNPRRLLHIPFKKPNPPQQHFQKQHQHPFPWRSNLPKRSTKNNNFWSKFSVKSSQFRGRYISSRNRTNYHKINSFLS